MCLIISAIAAEVSTTLYLLSSRRKELKLNMLMYMFIGSTLMWLVDGFFCLSEGEPFLDVSADDALLGLVIVVCAVAVWLAALAIGRVKAVKQG
ncbi:MAG: hypothetical protein IJH51_00160 [Christensenellaceae bacterium]|nr:hypothetical protein [Christensenellaceae bacterium]